MADGFLMTKRTWRIHGKEIERLTMQYNDLVIDPSLKVDIGPFKHLLMKRCNVDFMGGGADTLFFVVHGKEMGRLHGTQLPVREDLQIAWIEACGGDVSYLAMSERPFCLTCHRQMLHRFSFTGSFMWANRCYGCHAMVIELMDESIPEPDPEEYEFV